MDIIKFFQLTEIEIKQLFLKLYNNLNYNGAINIEQINSVQNVTFTKVQGTGSSIIPNYIFFGFVSVASVEGIDLTMDKGGFGINTVFATPTGGYVMNANYFGICNRCGIPALAPDKVNFQGYAIKLS